MGSRSRGSRFASIVLLGLLVAAPVALASDAGRQESPPRRSALQLDSAAAGALAAALLGTALAIVDRRGRKKASDPSTPTFHSS